MSRHNNLAWIKTSVRPRKVYGNRNHRKIDRASSPQKEPRRTNPFCDTCKQNSDKLESAWQAKAFPDSPWTNPLDASPSAKADSPQSSQQNDIVPDSLLDAAQISSNVISQRVGKQFQAQIPKLMSPGLSLQETGNFKQHKVPVVELEGLLRSKKSCGPKTPVPRSPISRLTHEVATYTDNSGRCFKQKSFPPLFVWREQCLKSKRAASSTQTPQDQLSTNTNGADSTAIEAKLHEGKRDSLQKKVDESSDETSTQSRRNTSFEIVRRFSTHSLALHISPAMHIVYFSDMKWLFCHTCQAIL